MAQNLPSPGIKPAGNPVWSWPPANPIRCAEQEADHADGARGPGVRMEGLRTSVGALLLGGCCCLGLLGGYLFFHSLAEGFSIVVAAGMFMVAWNARRFLGGGYLLFAGLAYAFVAALDFLHLLAYKGMGVFPGYDTNLATQFWIAARALEAGALVAAPFVRLGERRLPLVLGGWAAVTVAVAASIFTGAFPDCFVEGAGLTPFKKVAEYGISAALAFSLALLWRVRDRFDPVVARFVAGAIALAVGAELSFTFYVDVYGLSNFAGHLFKLLSTYLLYRAVIVTGFSRPVDFLFRDLKLRETELQASRDLLEVRVRERTAEAEALTAQLRLLAAELTHAERKERERLARLLHDHLQQLLVAAKLHNGMLARHPDERVRAVCARTGELLDQAVQDSRSLAVELSPPVLQHAGLSAALQWLACRIRDRHGLDVEVSVAPGAEPADASVRIFVFEAVRELLFNVVKHAGVPTARVSVDQDDAHLRVQVEDHGAGFHRTGDPAAPSRAPGFGLFSIQQRLVLMGGEMAIDGVPGGGTRVELRLPATTSDGPALPSPSPGATGAGSAPDVPTPGR